MGKNLKKYLSKKYRQKIHVWEDVYQHVIRNLQIKQGGTTTYPLEGPNAKHQQHKDSENVSQQELCPCSRAWKGQQPLWKSPSCSYRVNMVHSTINSAHSQVSLQMRWKLNAEKTAVTTAAISRSAQWEKQKKMHLSIVEWTNCGVTTQRTSHRKWALQPGKTQRP